jgi:hypothetical protein
MPRPSLLRLALAGSLALGCAETTTATGTVGDAMVDAPTSPADARSPDGGVCPPPAALPSAAACAALPELAAPANAVAVPTPGVTAYALRALRARADRERPGCAVEAWQDGAEAAARFTAPAGGRWRFTARGEHLGAVRVSRGCAAGGACAGFGGYRGERVTAALNVDAQVERGEGVGVVIDGCPAGATCDYELRAERVGDLACDFAGGVPSPCAEAQACAVDRCDPERFACAPLAHDRVAAGRAFADRATSRGFVSGALRPIAGGAVRAVAPYLMVDWLRADGSAAPGGPAYGSLDLVGDAFTLGPVEVPREAARARLWIANAGPMDQAVAEGLIVDVGSWTPRAESQACVPAELLARCGAGLACRGGGAGCVRPAALRVTGLRAWRDAGGTTLRLGIEGEGLGETVSQAVVELVGASGASLVRMGPQSVFARHEAPSEVPFTAALEVTGDPAVASLAEAARVRVRVIDTASRASEAFEAPIAAAALVAVGGDCARLDAVCDAGLTCAYGTGNARRCEPAPPARPCYLSPAVAVWAPPAAGTWVIAGTNRGGGGGTSCRSSRSANVAQAEFVAPTRGRYVFEGAGLESIDVRRACVGASSDARCVVAPAERRIEVDLAAGERVALAAMGTELGTPFTVTARVP